MTDSALIYSANARGCRPPGSRICALCGETRTVEVGHVDGHEENAAAYNLVWTCRSCNVLCANALRQAGIGRKTRQYNPASEGAKSLFFTDHDDYSPHGRCECPSTRQDVTVHR